MRDRIAPFLARQLREAPTATALDHVRDTRVAILARDLSAVPEPPLVRIYDERYRARLAHEGGHASCAWANGARDIEVALLDGGIGWCSYSPIESALEAITCCLVGIVAEAKAYPPALARYSDGCYDITAARLLIDKYNSAGWPPLTFEAAAAAAVAFVNSRAKQISALALALGSAGSLTDFEVRLFSRCAQ